MSEILAKRAGGQKLTRAEAGRLSQVGRASRKAAQSSAAPPAARRLVVEEGVEMPGLDALPPPPPVDEELCRATAGDVLAAQCAA